MSYNQFLNDKLEKLIIILSPNNGLKNCKRYIELFDKCSIKSNEFEKYKIAPIKIEMKFNQMFYL